MTRTALLLFAVAACRVSVAEIDFTHKVVPILRQHCAECHTKEESEGGFSFNTQSLLLESDAVIPGKPRESRLIELITSTDADEQMPPAKKGRLSEKEIATVSQWIEEGASWEPGFRFGTVGYEPPLLPRDVQLPPATFPGQHPIDRIVSSYLAQNKVTALAPVNERMFLKRVSLDLLGLLPTIEEQQKFLQDNSANARAGLIDRLLVRDHDYAEHWLTFWNDLLRNDYKGTGYIDGGRKQISKWLYSALVDNTPYDEFVRQLISPSDESEGFIRGIKWRGDVNASQVREIQFAQNVGQAFLGINMKCASCHDSFIDRWTLDESYGLAAIYSERQLEIHRCDKPTGRIAKAAWIFPELGQVDAEAEQPERLQQLSTLITHPNNGRFSRTIVNRLWHRLLGHGIVHPVDAMHTEPWNEDLLEYLANELVASGYDLKHILRLIATSQAYQSASVASEDTATADEYVFRGPVARHLTAEQFLDAVWQLTATHPDNIDAPVSMESYVESTDVPNVAMGQWIWGHDKAGSAVAGETVLFRYQLPLKEIPAKATCVVTCDNEYTLQVNGKEIRKDSDFAEPDVVRIAPYLHEGNNELTILGRNAGDSPNPAGLYVDLVLLNKDGTAKRIPSGSDWAAAMVEADADKGTEWNPAVPVANQNFLGDKVHNKLAAVVRQVVVGSFRPVRASMVRSNLLMRSLGRPNREQIVTTRPESLSTLQAIDLANGEILDELLARGGKHLLASSQHDNDFASTVFLAALCREPSDSERQCAAELLGPQANAHTIQDLLWTVIMLPEFQFVR
jgi:hypothetical protein